VVAIIGALGAAPLAVLWYAGHSLATRTDGRAAEPVSYLVTPVLNVRRASGTLVADIATRNLRTELSPILDKLPSSACIRVDAGGRVVVAKSSDKELVPASNQKIATAAVALEVLPSETRFTTRVAGTVENGLVTGDLFLVGGGDPLLVSREYLASERYPTTTPTYLDDLADKVKAAGVTGVTGSVVGDESYLDDDRYVDDWASGIRGTEGGPLGGLMVNDGAVVGKPLKPDNPAAAAAEEFARLLRARGITVGGEPREAKATPPESTIAEIASAPVAAVVGEMLTNSDNNTAEILVRHIGLARSLQPTTGAGLAVMRDVLEQWGIEGVTLKDGSGLSRGNRMTCASLVLLLERSPIGGGLKKGLAVAGRTGTLKEVLSDSPAAGKLLGKTGTLLNVKTLGGVMPIDAGDEVVFALFLNGAGWADQGNYRPLWEALARAVTTYPQGPTAGQVRVLGAG
jgi:D-alanyl-D-alanine carboxypeptidase/D-alanyl-D-alanine-endopeptidase (penicillin-binding protein 4)